MSLATPERSQSSKRSSKVIKEPESSETKEKDAKEPVERSRSHKKTKSSSENPISLGLIPAPDAVPNPPNSSTVLKSKSKKTTEIAKEDTPKRKSADSEPLVKTAKNDQVEIEKLKLPPKFIKKSAESFVASGERRTRERSGSNTQMDFLLRNSSNKLRAWDREAEESPEKKATAKISTWTASTSPTNSRLKVLTSASRATESSPGKQSIPNGLAASVPTPTASALTSTLTTTPSKKFQSSAPAGSPSTAILGAGMILGGGPRPDSSSRKNSESAGIQKAPSMPVNLPSKAPSNLVDRLKSQTRRRRAQSVSPLRIQEKEDTFPYVDAKTLRRTRSESYGFMHSWDFTPVFVKVDRNQLKTKALKKREKKKISPSKSMKDSKRSVLKASATRDLHSSEVSSPRSSIENLFDVSRLKYEEEDPDSIEGSPLHQLINYIILENAKEDVIVDFIYAHEQVIASEEFFEQLVQRYNLTSSKKSDNELLEKMRNSVEKIIQLWITLRYFDFFDPDNENPPLLAPLRSFLESLNRLHPSKSSMFSTLIEKQDKRFLDLRSVNYDIAPEPLLSKEAQQLKVEEYGLLLLHPLEVARQLTIIDFGLFQQLELSELVNCRWMKSEEEAKKTSPNALSLIERFNAISFWMATEIVSAPNKKLRVAVLHYVIKLARHLKEIHNYHALMAVYCALNMFQIQRLTQTWADVPKTDVKFLKSLDEFLTSRSNYVNIRNQIMEIQKLNETAAVKDHIACLPFHGVFLKAFVGINENLTFLDDYPEHVNVDKLRMIAVQSKEISRLQLTPYNLIPVKKIQSYLIEVVAYNAGEELLSKLSKQCEQSQEAVADSMKKVKEKESKLKESKEKVPIVKVDSIAPAEVKKSKSVKSTGLTPGVNILGRKASSENPPAPINLAHPAPKQ